MLNGQREEQNAVHRSAQGARGMDRVAQDDIDDDNNDGCEDDDENDYGNEIANGDDENPFGDDARQSAQNDDECADK